MAFPRIALLEGERGQFPNLADTALILPNALADSREWGEITLDQPVTSSTGTAYAVFYFPETETTGIGEGTGPGIGIRRARETEPFYLTGDGVHWAQFDEAFEIAIEPVYAQGKVEPRVLADLQAELLVEDGSPIRYRTELLPPKPNPFNPRVEIAFTLEKPGRVKIRVYDVRGRVVTTLVDESRPAGPNNVIWEGTDDRGSRVASGVYFVRLEAPGLQAQRRMALVR